MRSSKHEVSETLGLPAPTPTRNEWVKRHWAKFWWLHLISFILISLAVILIAIYVAVPAIAQRKINLAKLEIQGVAVENPEPDWYLISINSTIRTDGQVKATIDPFVGEMYLEDINPPKPFAKIQFPQTNANKFQAVNVSKQYIKVTDRAAFTQFNTWFINNETLKVTIKGKPSVTPRGLAKSYTVTFKKTLDLRGLNNFSGMKVTDSRALLDAKPKNSSDYRNFWALTEIPNPSHFSLQIGNVVFDTAAAGQDFGKLYVDNFSFVPGMNTVNATSNIDQAQVAEIVTKDAYCHTGVIPFHLVGNNVTNADGHYISYFADALRHTNQTIAVNVTEALEKSIGAGLGCSSL